MNQKPTQVPNQPRTRSTSQPTHLTDQHVETLIVGAGQAGLATAYHLRRRERECLVVDGMARLGDNWRCHYDSLRLFTPAKVNGLPGMAFPSDDPWSFPTRDEVADFLERYAVTYDLPVRLRTRVDRLESTPEGGFRAHIGTDTITCDNVVIATGTFGREPQLPTFAADLDPGIRQLHSAAYKNPAQLAPGPVLVVGASHSGCDIAYELAETRETTLIGPDRGQIPFEWGTARMKAVFPVVEFAFAHILTRRTPMGRKAMGEVRAHGGPMLRVKRHHLAERGVRRLENRVTAVRNGRPVLDDGTVLDVANVVWCTGFRHDFDWIDLPVVGDDGWPNEYRGVVESVPGLFFCGLSFQYAFASMTLPGIGRDTGYVARQIVARGKDGRRAPAHASSAAASRA